MAESRQRGQEVINNLEIYEKKLTEAEAETVSLNWGTPDIPDMHRPVYVMVVADALVPNRHQVINIHHVVLAMATMSQEPCHITLHPMKKNNFRSTTRFFFFWFLPSSHSHGYNTLCGHHFTDNIFKCIFGNQNCCILIQISLKSLPN